MLTDEHETEGFATEDLDLFITYHHDAIRRIAKSKARGMGFTTADDIEQAIMEHVVNKWHLFAGVDKGRAERMFAKTASQFVSKESDDYMYFTGAYVYNPAEVRRHLRDSAWVEGQDCPDVDAKLDLQAAFKETTKARQRALYRHYCLGVAVEDMTQAEKRSVYRGVDDLTNWLNRREAVRTVSLDEIRAKLFTTFSASNMARELPTTGLSGRINQGAQ